MSMTPSIKSTRISKAYNDLFDKADKIMKDRMNKHGDFIGNKKHTRSLAISILKGISQKNYTINLLKEQRTKINEKERIIDEVVKEFSTQFENDYKRFIDFVSNEKRKQQLEEEIELEARRKALDNIKKAIISEQYEDENKKELEKKVEVVNTATEMLKNDENMPADIKDKAYNYMLDDFRDEKRELIEKMKENEADQIEKIEKEDKELEEQLKDSLIYQIAEKREKARIEYEEEKKKEREEELALIRENSKNKNIEVDISNEEDDSII